MTKRVFAGSWCGREWCLLCYAAVKGRAFVAGHAPASMVPAKRRRFSMGWLKKPVETEPTLRGEVTAGGGSWEDRRPALVEHLNSLIWPDGSPRTPSTLTLFAENGLWKCCLNDRDGSRVAFLSADDPETLLDALEVHLREDRLDWRPARGNGRTRK